MDIKIKAGAGLTKILQTTVTIPQAFCELVKNSVQNGASECWIYLEDFSAKIIDNGVGLNLEEDSSGMNGFEKYFVFGSSFEQFEDMNLLRLGKMGIGGKIANDRISDASKPQWKIYSKNNNEIWAAEYKPTLDQVFLTDQKIKTWQVHKLNNSKFKEFDSGLFISINKIRESIALNGWPIEEIKKEISEFFGDQEGLKIYVNDELLNLKFNYIGTKIPEFQKKFTYEINGEKKQSSVDFELYFVRNKDSISELAGQRVSLYDFAKICNISSIPFSLTSDKVDQANLGQTEKIQASAVFDIFHSLIGRITCEDINTVLDEGGLPAKDLSHHNLRDDHPLTKPLKNIIYESLINWIIGFIKIDKKEQFSAVEAVALEASSFVAQMFSDQMLFDYFESTSGEFEMLELGFSEEFQENIVQTLQTEHEEQESDLIIQISPDSRVRGSNPPPVRKLRKDKFIGFSVIDFSEKDKYLNSKKDSSKNLKVLINSLSPKFKHSKNTSSIALGLHIAECIISETYLFLNPMVSSHEVQEKINIFYDQHLMDVFENISVIKLGK